MGTPSSMQSIAILASVRHALKILRRPIAYGRAFNVFWLPSMSGTRINWPFIKDSIRKQWKDETRQHGRNQGSSISREKSRCPRIWRTLPLISKTHIQQGLHNFLVAISSNCFNSSPVKALNNTARSFRLVPLMLVFGIMSSLPVGLLRFRTTWTEWTQPF